MPETLPLREAAAGEMEGRIAYFKDLKGFDKGFSDDGLPGARRTLFNVLGFQDRPGDPNLNSPVGQQAAEMAAIKVSDGFNLGYIKCRPGNGPLMHNHDTNETFIPITGPLGFDVERGGHQDRDSGSDGRLRLPARRGTHLQERHRG